jgi:hypothetical protein
MPVSRAFRADSSRTSRAAAGWPNAGKCEGTYVEKAKRATFPRRFSWLRPRVILESRNHVLAGLVQKANTDIVNDERMRWVAAQRAAGVDTDFVIDHTGLGGRFSFLAVGDPGEGDASQYVVAPHLLRQEDTDFAVIVSDVIYPSGESNDYVDAFYRPYQQYPKPIYALPGNHDWYSLLTGFMWNICGVEPLPLASERLASYSWQERLARFLWLRPRQPERELLEAYREQRWRVGQSGDEHATPHQLGSYFAIQTEPLLILCIDTGTGGVIDREQADWLLRMAARPGKKLLLTGRPIWVNGEHKPCEIRWLPGFSRDRRPARTGDPAPVRTGDEPVSPPYETVDEIVRDSEFEFLGVIGGDVHNYQRYPVRLGNATTAPVVQYIVSGGGGAFMSPTHTVEDLDELGGPVGEDELRLYPLRGDSLARFAQGSTGRLRRAMAGLFAGVLALWWLALQVWNPHNETLDMPLEDAVRRLNVSPGTDMAGVSPLSWLPSDADYDRWGAIVLGGVALAIGVGLLALPWFQGRVKAVFAIVAAGAALLAWNGALFDLPAGRHSYVVAGVIGAVAIPVLALERTREVRFRYRLAVALGLFLAAAVLADRQPSDADVWDFARELAVIAAIALLLVGGPRLKPLSSLAGGAAIAALALVLFLVHVGWSWFPIALVALILTVFLVYAVLLLDWLLLSSGRVDPDEAAAYMSRDLQPPVRQAGDVEPPTVGFVTRKKLRGLKPGARSFFLYLGETVYSALFDYNDQPFFKSFLRIDVDGGDVKIYCFGVAEEIEPATVEDHVRWNAGRSRWTDARAILGRVGDGAVVGEAEWYDDGGISTPQLVFQLEDAEVRNRFAVLFSDGEHWLEAGTLDYGGREEHWDPKLEREGRWPRRIGLRRMEDAGNGPTFAEGTFI